MEMDDFFCTKYELPDGISEKVIESSSFDREVVFIRGATGTSVVCFAFKEFTPTSGGGTKDFSTWEPSDKSDELRFVLPAGEELWTGATSSGWTLSFIVTKR